MNRPTLQYGSVLRLFRGAKYAYLRLMRAKTPPHATALGLALGVFIGFLPIIPFQTIVAAGLAFVLRCGKIAAAVGTWVTNPFNVPLVYYLLYKIGRFVLPVTDHSFDARKLAIVDLLHSGWSLFWVMCLGGVLVGIPAAVVTYFVFLNVIRRYHDLRARRRRKRRR